MLEIYEKSIVKKKHLCVYMHLTCHFLLVAHVGLEDALPAGNVAYGLAWNYFYGYLNLVLESM